MILGSHFLVSTLLLAGLALQGPSTSLVNQTFKNSDEGWMAFGDSPKMVVAHTPDIALPDAGALRLDYTVAKGQANGLYLPVPFGAWAKAKSIKFRIRSDSTTVVAVSIQKQDGGRFVSMIAAPKDTWQPVELSTADFILAQDKNDPKDPNGKLSMDRITGIGVIDIAQMFVGSDNPALESMLNIKKGDHTLYLDSFTVGTDPLPPSTSSVGDDVQIESFAHPQLSWLALGSMKLTRETGLVLDGPALRADYHESTTPSILVRAVPTWVLTGTKSISFDIASLHPGKYLMQLEQTDGGKYNEMFDVTGDSKVQHVKLSLSDFHRSDDSTDTDNKLHLALVKNLLFLDASGMLLHVDQDNTLWLNHISASAK